MWNSEKAGEEELKQISQKLRIQKEAPKEIQEKIDEIKDYYEGERIA